MRRVAAVARDSAPASARASAGRSHPVLLAGRLRVTGVVVGVAACTAGVALAASILGQPSPTPPAPTDAPPVSGVVDPAPLRPANEGRTRTQGTPSESLEATPDRRDDRRDDGRTEPSEPADERTGSAEGPGADTDEQERDGDRGAVGENDREQDGDTVERKEPEEGPSEDGDAGSDGDGAGEGDGSEVDGSSSVDSDGADAGAEDTTSDEQSSD